MRLLLFLAGGAITIIGAIGIMVFPILGIPVTIIGIMMLLSGLKGSAHSIKDEQLAKKKCPQCAEVVLEDAKICRYCRHDFIASGSEV